MTITKKELLDKFKDLPEDANIIITAWHYEPSGRKSNITDIVEIESYNSRGYITIEEEKPECFDYEF